MSGPDTWDHDALARDLARWLKCGAEHWVWLNAALGTWGGARPDVMAFRRWRYQTPSIRAYECKVSRSDLMTDLRSEKWKTYLEHCQSVTFIMPSGLCKADDIPAECGVMFRSKRGWRTERQPADVGRPVSAQALAKLLSLHPLVIDDKSSEEGRESYHHRILRDHSDRAFLRDIGERNGRKVAEYLGHVAAGRDPVGQAREKAAKLLEKAKREALDIGTAFAPVLQALGLADDASSWTIASKIKQRAKELAADGQLRAVREAVRKADAALIEVRHLVSLPPEADAA